MNCSPSSYSGAKGDVLMKRDILLMALCLCILGGAAWLGKSQVAPAVSTSPQNGRVLILDAGHGGEDGGASSAGGDKESDINLNIVLKLELLMAFLGVDTQLTRQDDRSLHSSDAQTIREKKVSDLKNRVAMIDSTSNAFLISIHQNYFTDSRYSGAQVFFNGGDVSRQWGECTQGILREILDPSNDREAKPMPDGIYLFEHIDCPAILVECGFLSNGEEASLLLTDTYQRKVVLALAGAYFREVQMIPTVWRGE